MADKSKKPPLGSGKRFDQLVKDIIKKSKGKYTKEQAEAIAAKIGMQKLGKKRFQQLAAKGLRRAIRAKKKGGSK